MLAREARGPIPARGARLRARSAPRVSDAPLHGRQQSACSDPYLCSKRLFTSPLAAPHVRWDTAPCPDGRCVMRIVRWAGLLALAVAVSVVASPVAQAAPHRDGRLVPAAKRLAGLTGGQLIGEETRLLLELPAAENPLFGAGESCFRAGHRGKVLIVWTRPESQAPAECTVKPGTSVFLIGVFVFCDQLEPPPFFAVGEKAQRQCALEGLLTHPLLEFDAILVTVDGRTPVDIGTQTVPRRIPSGHRAAARRQHPRRRSTGDDVRHRGVRGDASAAASGAAHDHGRSRGRTPCGHHVGDRQCRARRLSTRERMEPGRPDPSGAWLESLAKP